jgi:hypothetical protein
MFASFFVVAFVSIPLGITLVRLFQRPETAPPAPEHQHPRYTMRDFHRPHAE